MNKTKSLQERLDQILPKLQSDEFLNNKGLGNEIGFYIFDYPAQSELQVREHITFIEEKLQNRGVNFININIFESILKLLESRKLLQKSFDIQKTKGSKALLKALKGPLDQQRIAEYISKKIKTQPVDFVLLTGLGSAWPLIRGHSLLNALHSLVGSTPLVLFYPGEYNGTELHPFGRIDSANYYRAFSLVS
jgi:hypothetical protein